MIRRAGRDLDDPASPIGSGWGIPVAGQAASYRRSAPFAHAALVSGSAGIVVTAGSGQPASVMAFTFAAGKITEIYILADRSRLTRLGLAPPDNSTGRTQ